jgi:hypothetical protein
MSEKVCLFFWPRSRLQRAWYTLTLPVPSTKTSGGMSLPRRTPLLALLDLAAAVHDKRNLLAVLHCFDAGPLGSGLDVSDLRIARGFEFGDQLLLREGMGGGENPNHHQSAKGYLSDCSSRHDLYSDICDAERHSSSLLATVRHNWFWVTRLRAPKGLASILLASASTTIIVVRADPPVLTDRLILPRRLL